MDAIRAIADTDNFEGDWDSLRTAIKDSIEKNISLFLTTTEKPSSPAPYLPVNSANGGLKLPPFLPRPPNRSVPSEMLVAYMTEQEANTLKNHIFTQLDQFDTNPPFTIQRLCELCVEPKRHYNSVGKYLRAVEKSILVTSTWDSFPPLTEAERNSSGRSAITLGSTLQSAPSTPLFSPIPFLHEDARRSKSRSPPPTPLTLNPIALGLDLGDEPKALGLVDELDAPGPGHLSDHPTSLSAAESFDMFDFKAEDAMDTSEGLIPLVLTDTAMDLDSTSTNIVKGSGDGNTNSDESANRS